MVKKLVEGIDFFFNKMLPKKLIVLVVATWLTNKGLLDGDWWGILASVYTGSNLIQKFVPMLTAKLNKGEGE